MSTSHAPSSMAVPPHALSWARLRPAWIASAVISVLMLPGWQASYAVLLGRLLIISTMLVLAFGLFERWPRRLPRRLSRWALQVVSVAVAAPLAAALAYQLTTLGDARPWWLESQRMTGYATMSVFGLLIGPWMAMIALLHQIRGEAQRQALAFELERSEFARRQSDARLHLLQAQVQPHFLFNTLANVRELVDTGSPQAAPVLGHLIAYLRAAVPQLERPVTTLGQELDLVQAYLQIMHMRMPDRLQFAVHAEPAAHKLVCPPLTLLTLVENAIRHGIDPGESGGRVEVRVRVRDGRCHIEVLDTGVGFNSHSDSLGTGLSTLRERLSLVFDGDASLSLAPLQPQGVSATLDFPARQSAS